MNLEVSKAENLFNSLSQQEKADLIDRLNLTDRTFADQNIFTDWQYLEMERMYLNVKTNKQTNLKMEKDSITEAASETAGNQQLCVGEVSRSNIRNRKGRFTISKKFFYEDADPLVLEELFSRFFPAAIDHAHNSQFYDSISYIGISPLFDEVEEACVIPEYQAVFSIDDNGNHRFEKFEKL